MRVETTSASYLYTASLRATERVQKITANAAQAASAPQAVEDAPCDESSKPVDFTCMTFQEMYDWLHEQWLQGEISDEDWGTLSVWVDIQRFNHFNSFNIKSFMSNGAIGQIDRTGSDEALDIMKKSIDFMELMRESVEFARAHEYDDGGRYQRALEAGWAAMQRAQGVPRSVDVFA